MATFTWSLYAGTPAWIGLGANTIVFSGSASDLSVPITVASWNAGTHIGSGDPGTDQCTAGGGSAHAQNVEYTQSTGFKLNGGAERALTSLLTTECTIQIKFTDAIAVATSNARFYTYNGTTTTTEATGVDVYAFEQGNGSTWTKINDSTGPVGGDNAGECLSLADQGSANTEHFFYIAISASPESVGAKGDFDFGVALTYS